MKRLERRNRPTGDGGENRWENLLDLKPTIFYSNPWPPIWFLQLTTFGLGDLPSRFHPSGVVAFGIGYQAFLAVGLRNISNFLNIQLC